MSMYEQLPESTSLERLHASALGAASAGHHDEAAALYQQALDLLPKDDRSLKKAHLLRDTGFNEVRRALQNPQVIDPQAVVATALTTIHDAAKIESEILAATQVNDPEYKKVVAEHGATTTILGRIATTFSIVEHGVPGKTDLYNTAHGLLKYGNNAYYRTSNALTAARHERAHGDTAASAKWFGRAVHAVALAAVRDRDNLKPSLATFARRAPDIRSKDAALHSVRLRP